MQIIMGLVAGYLSDKAVQDWNWTPLKVRRVNQAITNLGLGTFLLMTVFLAHTAVFAMTLITIGMALCSFAPIAAPSYQVSYIQSFILRLTRPIHT
jgi:hypothetical protein